MSSPAASSGSSRPASVDLRVSVGRVSLKNPIIAASGTFAYGIEFAQLVDLNRLGGIVVKGLSAQPMEGAPAPRICETASGMVNAIGLQNIGVRAFVAEKLPLLRQCFPGRTDLRGYSQAELNAIAMRLNQRPAKTLGFETPASRLRAIVASTHWMNRVNQACGLLPVSP